MTNIELASIDLTACEREPVHIPGAIQPFGVLVAFALPTWSIAHVSTNAPELFGAASAEAMIGRRIEDILSPKIVHDLRNTFQAAMISGFAERLGGVATGPAGLEHDVLVHASGQLAIAEFIPTAGADTIRSDPTTLVKTIIDRLRRTTTFTSFLTSAARQIRAVTGYDRVMIYRFLEDDSGEVVAEAVRAGLSPFLHLRYPASDIPAQARALFKRQWLRMIPQVAYDPIPIVPALTTKSLPVDLSLSTLRSASPVHLQYLKNMGCAATLTVSIINNDRLWGLVACHHETPRRISAATAAAVELFAQVFSTQIEAKQQRDELALISSSRASLDQLIVSLRPDEALFPNLASVAALLQDILPCDGFGVWTESRFEGEGIRPPDDAIPELIRFLSDRPPDRVFATSALARELPDAMRYVPEASGLVSIPLSRTPRDYLLLFRREVIRTVEWGGDPNKAVDADGSGKIGPRSSFAAWQETVRGTSQPWRPSEVSSAETLRVSLLDVMLRRASAIDRERKIAQESQLLLVAELNHRVKNVLAVIRSLVRQSAQGATSIKDFTSDLQSRVHALAVAHDQLTLAHWKSAPLEPLIEAEARAWTEVGDERLKLSGPAVMIDARAYQTLALVLHEMMTNAAKYGALSVKDGQLHIEWRLEKTGDLVLTWQERNGPPVSPPTRRGFGSVVVEQSIPFELQGEARIDHAEDGVTARFMIPYDYVQKAAVSATSRAELPTTARADLRGKNLLLVEDSMMIALDAQTMLQNCGAEVEIAATANDARRALRLNRFDGAILDVNLYTETSFAIAEDLQERAIPFVFATGYGETVTVPEKFGDVHVIAKPYAEDSLRAAFA